MYVLDPLKGYLLAIEQSIHGHDADAFNFGPDLKSLSVARIDEHSRLA
jgi:hypothetical protein